MQKLIISAVIVVTILAIIATVAKTNTKVELQQIDVKTKQQEIQTLKQDQSDYEQRLKEAHGDKKKLEQLKLEQKRLQDENKRLQSELQAKLDKQAMEAENVAYASPQAVSEPIQSEDYYVNWIIQHESGGNPNAVNPSSGACGLFQRLPCTVPLGNVEVQMADGLAYIQSRYGSAKAAYDFWQINNWY
jgi:hypothetical protein